jgi:hypothetical protein
MTKKQVSILKRWSITEAELTDLVDQNPSLRGTMIGYIGEIKFHNAYLHHPAITEAHKDDDHDRTRKGDRRIVYRGQTFVIEVKSLQANSVRSLGGDKWAGKAQVDASDRREVTFPNGSTLQTTCLLRGEFDLLAVCCFMYGEKEWRFAFALESEIPANVYKKYTDYQRKHLLPSGVKVDWPIKPPFSDDPFALLDKLIAGKPASKSARLLRAPLTLWNLNKD